MFTRLLLLNVSFIACLLNEIIYLLYFSGLVSIVDSLRETCLSKIKQNAVKQEHEKHDELKRCALRALCVICKIPEAGKSKVLIRLSIFYSLLISAKTVIARDAIKQFKDTPQYISLHRTMLNNTNVHSAGGDAFASMDIE